MKKKYTIGIVGVEQVMEEQPNTSLSYLMQTDDLVSLYEYMELLALQNHSLLGLSLADIVEAFTDEASESKPCSYEMIEEGLLCWAIYGRTEVMHHHFEFENEPQYDDAKYLTEYGVTHSIEEMRANAIEVILTNHQH